ncbi:MAG: hypothetical protein ACOYMN_08995 [Roseimicrobium sp.]
MKIASRSAPSFLWLVVGGTLVLAGDLSAQQTPNYAKKILHDDGTSTESVSDTAKRELRETTYDPRGVAIMKRIVLLNESGLPVQGVIYDGSDNLAGRVQFWYDDLGRPKEERSLNAQAQVFRRKFFLYDATGAPLPAKVVDYAENAPRIRSASVNFTNVPSRGRSAPSSTGTKLPGAAPQIQTVSPRTGAGLPMTPNANVPTAPTSEPKEPEKKKRGLFDFLKRNKD